MEVQIIGAEVIHLLFKAKLGGALLLTYQFRHAVHWQVPPVVRRAEAMSTTVAENESFVRICTY
jgi:hypothetical protein